AGWVIDREVYTVSQLSQPGGLAPQIGSLKASGADVIVMFTTPAATASALLTAAGLHYRPQWMASSVGSDPNTLIGLVKSQTGGRVGSQLLEGMVGGSSLPSYGEPGAGAWIQLFQWVHDLFIPDLPFDGNTVFGMAAAYTFAQALKAAGTNPTRASLVQAVENGGFRGPGLVPFTYSKTNHQGYSGEQVFVVRSGAAISVGPPQVTDDGDGVLSAYATPPPPPSSGGIGIG
ncbi:MAG TPA: ABC transporter substrate-binding protein, partial [Candidatus Eisenbacteria bacterium]|nr:ABC transporter substrate-binding protein [Candidatus Eisenbacteria bacterium]